MARLVTRWERGGLTQAAFAGQIGMPAATFSWWRHRLRRAASALPAVAAPALTELVLAAPARADAEVVLRNRRLVRVPLGGDGGACAAWPRCGRRHTVRRAVFSAAPPICAAPSIGWRQWRGASCCSGGAADSGCSTSGSSRGASPRRASTCAPAARHRRIIGEDVTAELDYQPAAIFITKRARPKLACPHCRDGVTQAALPARPIERGRPAPGLLAQVVTGKYADHLPLLPPGADLHPPRHPDQPPHAERVERRSPICWRGTPIATPSPNR